MTHKLEINMENQKRELKLEDLVGYFPYGLKGIIKDKIVSLRSLHQNSLETNPSVHGFTYCSFRDFKPLLRPLQDLTKEIEHNGERFVPIMLIRNYGISKMECTNNDIDILLYYIHAWEDKTKCPYWVFEIMHALHFNIHNLPEHLCVNLNDVKK
jgi:hypothetical protein